MAKSDKKKPKDDDQRSEAETARVRDATLRTMLKTPPKPDKKGKKGGKK